MTSHDTLEAAQQAFAAALDDPAADTALACRLLPANAERLHERLGLYRGNARAARRLALANAYPVLLALTGDAYFDALALAYSREHPSRDADLNRFGAQLPEFVERYETQARYAYFADVARLEWALHVAAYAANATPLDAQQWQALGAQRLSQSRLHVHPACAALALHFDAAAILRAHEPGGEWPERVDASSWALVVRPHWRPIVLVHTHAAHAAFLALRDGATLDAALALAFDIDPAFDFGAQWRAWIEARAIVGVRND
ncbi:putative DNA-binding protein [Paraburkholderia unamae]|uniref:HvfC/BufC family peptide modification chaperone n=1 Tax=Paraburkholderia unamae TaxID=219649 RepID=UPI000DC2E45A|nr:putative DNA-binding domain-containing protein [Paraburkholderia unamae]RAR67006.1 putative DNA-binding protein [Paraburkholderia unamae]